MANFYQFRLKAGLEFQAPVRGKLILVDDTGGADGIDITPMLNNGQGRTMPGRKKAFKCWTEYDALILKAAVDCTVSMFLSDQDVSLGFADGALVNVVGEVTVGNDPTARIPVDIGGGAINVTADNVGINNTDANAVPVRKPAFSVLVTKPPVVAGLAAVALVNDSTLRRLMIRNSHASALVAIGAADVTMANGACVIAPGDTWIEEDAAGLAWYVVSDTAGVTVQVGGAK